MAYSKVHDHDVISYHNFAWPFTLSPRGGDTAGQPVPDLFRCDSFKAFYDGLDRIGWRPLAGSHLDITPDAAVGPDDMTEFARRFQPWQYLSNSARQIFADLAPVAIDTGGIDVCRVYQLDIDPGKSTYEMEVGDKLYRLRIEGVDLYLFSFCCGVLWFRTSYCHEGVPNQEDLTEQQILADVKLIGDLARRIALPFMPTNENGEFKADEFIITADRIHIHLVSDESDSKGIDIDFSPREMLGAQGESTQKPTGQTLRDLMDGGTRLFGKSLLGIGESSALGVHSSTDDRMFEMVIVKSDPLKWALSVSPEPWKETEGGDEECNRRARKLASSLYEIVYLDKQGSCSAKNQRFREDFLSQALNTRWSGYGTLYGASEYSFIMVCEGKPYYKGVIVPFLEEYVPMVTLVLAQRMGIAKFSNDASMMAEMAQSGRSPFGICGNGWAKELSGLQRNFVVFQNQVLVSEYSNQQQGIELYNLLRKQLYVDDELAELDDQLESLCDSVSGETGDYMGEIGTGLALAAIGVDVIVSTLTSIMMPDGSCKIGLFAGLLIAAGVVTTLIGIPFLRRSNKPISRKPRGKSGDDHR